MKEHFEKIKLLLTEIEVSIGGEQEQQFAKNYNALELPNIVSSIVDFLHPLLTPYEIALYWYLFNNSIVKSGEQYVRASTRGMSAVAISASGQSKQMSYGVIKKTIDSLKNKGVISVAGDTSREGTIYKVSIPDEIDICKKRRKKCQMEDIVKIDKNTDLDYYNISENRLKVFERDSYKCYYCSKQLTRFSATLDHIVPVSKEGDNSFDNLVTACLHCNSERGNQPVMEYLTRDT